ncbi:LOW QUALITY PROTEIN: uncharacterized protein ACN2A1_011733 [Glossina fuscipes fuscipes]
MMLRRQHFYSFYWSLLLMGLYHITMECDARAVNVSNTWTMPQEGLNVFYRFFRDRISWFEADAVCQFHHANLVTVDNSFQFDATRDLLRELDVNDIVWIGLMRPQSSDRFMWSNSRPLVTNTGYWAESLPLMDAPLCAVIDPIRDYRWHALRCGGPETASFLCEMPVPSWADACILKDMPNLTMQYMADTASIELIRNCQEEGLLRTACKGKQDREQALQSLICPRERLEAQRINDITNSHFKSMQIINSIPTDNNENNNIELLPIDGNYGSVNANSYTDQVQTEQNTVQKLIEQFNVDELMQADEQPSQMETINNFYKLQGPIAKPVKKSGKKLTEFTKKDLTKQQLLENEKKEEILKMEEMMLGDQPISAQRGEPEIAEHILEDVVSNEIMEHLPHSKKVLTVPTAQTLHTIELMKEKLHKGDEKQNEKLLKLKFERKIIATSSTAATITANTATATTTAATASLITTTDINLNTDKSSTTVNNLTTPKPFTQMHSTTIVIPSIAAAAATISHPIHPQQPHSNVFTESPPRLPHTKETADNSHFIPPMLLVKSHYVPTSKHVGHGEHRTLEYHTEPVEKVEQTASPGIIIEMEGTTLKTLDDTAKLIVSEKYRDIEESTIKAVTEQETNRNKPNNNSNSIRIDYSTTKQPLATTDETKLYTTLQTTIINPTTQKIQTISRNVAVVEQQNDDTNTMDTAVIAIQDQQKNNEEKIVVETTKSALTTEKMHDLVAKNATNIEEALAKKEQKEIEEQEEEKEVEEEDDEKKNEKWQKRRVKTAMLALNSKQKPDQKEQALITTKTISYTQTIEHANGMTDRATTEKPKVAIYAAETQNVQTEISVQNVEEKDENKKQKSEQEQEQEQEQQEEQEQEQQKVKQKETIVKTMEHTTFPTKMTTTVNNNKEPITLNIEIAKVNEKPEEENISTSNKHQPTTTTTPTTITTTTTTAITTTTTAITPTTSNAINNTTTNVVPNTSITTHSTHPVDINVTQTTRNFLKVTTEEPYKPNRRRSLTKPETMSYIKKILG